MRVSILLVTHNNFGRLLLDTVVDTLGFCPLYTECLTIAQDSDPDAQAERARELLAGLPRSSGVLILTDIYGATPCNLALRLQVAEAVRIVSGLNLPMLLRVFNYPNLDLDALTEKALSGGRDGVMLVESEQAKP
ncbi:PTS fructose transporter subunit IIA [Methylonatrum kenyense]|uniref:PTS sugar transporter subunit IIA n=1 Tax=Methylonatrum kenyense TaxID=455253 RepID=UPI0020C13C05|nr:PTS fructose transporter subunit IIA [Methylonatrum kenyense]MCK8516252.1 PTS fructose transporter subunit IIA [Methylonatrum kenyense]